MTALQTLSGPDASHRDQPTLRRPPVSPPETQDRGSRWPALALVLVAGGYAVATIRMGLHVPLGRDEVVYASQVGADPMPAYFSAPRARGVTWLVAPLLQFTRAVPPLRVYLGILSGVGMVVAFWPWLRVRGLSSAWVVPTAAALFGSLWLSLFYGNAVMPNLWVAYGAVAAVGFLLRWSQRSSLLDLVGLAASVAFVTLIRPTDGAVLLALLALAAVVVLRWRAVPAALVGAGAFALAVVPWAVEANQRFGGVVARLRAGSATEGGFLGTHSALMQLRVVDGPLLCRPTCRAAQAALPVDGLIWWAVWAAMCAVAIVLAVRRGRSSAVLVPLWVGLGMAVPYVVAVGYAAPRFLHPAYALLGIVVADGVVAVALRARRLQPVWVVLVLAAFSLFLGNQAHTAARLSAHETAKRGAQLHAVAELRAAGIRPGCTISGTNAPVVAYALQCHSTAASGHDANTTKQALADLALHEQVVLLRPAGASLNPPHWGLGRWQEGYTAPRHAHKPLWTVFLPVDLAATPTDQP